MILYKREAAALYSQGAFIALANSEESSGNAGTLESVNKREAKCHLSRQKRTQVSPTYAKELTIPMYNITDSKLVTKKKKKKKKKIAIQYVGRAGSALADLFLSM